MRNYVIINGVNSLTKNGLAIKELPPITKTMMRTQREEIDGRDGDIITDLGYSAYDKSMTIGLFGTGYDIDDIIAFFNQEGTIVFSNEPDKYYNFKILDQIDYNKLLKFKEATIRFHCQPFKYPLDSTPLETEFIYHEAEGTTLSLNDTAFNIMKMILKPQQLTVEDGSIKTITGDNQITVVKNPKIHGIERLLTASSSAWTRTNNSVGLVANATHDGSDVVNDFDNEYPWNGIYTYNYDPVTDSEVARYGDPDFKFDGSNGEVMTYIPEFYYKRWQDGTKEHIQTSEFPIAGFTRSPAFSVGRYNTYYDGSKMHSYSGYCPEVNRNITSFRTLSRQVGNNFGQLDWRYFILQILYLVEYADYNSQSKLGNGATGFRVNNADAALMAETSVNRILLPTSNANQFDIGQQVSIGTSATYNWTVAKNRTVLSKETYSDGTNSGTMVYFDGDPVNIAVGNVLWTTGQKSGTCDGLGMKSGCYKTNKNACIYRGIENPFGNVYQFLDGLNIQSNQPYICYDPTEYVVDKFTSPFNKLGYTQLNTAGTWNWVKTMGYDENNQLVSLPIESGGSASTYITDQYVTNTGNRIALVGGAFANATYAGFFLFAGYSASSNTNYNGGSRLLRY